MLSKEDKINIIKASLQNPYWWLILPVLCLVAIPYILLSPFTYLWARFVTKSLDGDITYFDMCDNMQPPIFIQKLIRWAWQRYTPTNKSHEH